MKRSVAGGIMLIIGGVWIFAQVWGGAAVERLGI